MRVLGEQQNTFSSNGFKELRLFKSVGQFYSVWNTSVPFVGRLD